MAVTRKSEIKAVAIFKITSKTDGTTCWAVPSDSDPNALYKTCFDENSHGWTCTCKHGEYQAQRGQDAHCKHVAAVQTSIKANLHNEQAPKSEETSTKGVVVYTGKPVYCDEVDDPFINASLRKPVETNQKGSLHSSKAFSLMR